ncbi:hypothetical protein BU15DRAFT_24123, partial [Melanogaster broomeanus]
QSIYQHLYFIIAVAALLLLVFVRLSILRRRGQPASDFFRIFGTTPAYPYGAETGNVTAYGSSYQPGHGVPLAPLPAAYRPERRVHAADTDADGRRLDPAGEDWDGKDALPAYDGIGRPPKYIETD